MTLPKDYDIAGKGGSATIQTAALSGNFLPSGELCMCPMVGELLCEQMRVHHYFSEVVQQSLQHAVTHFADRQAVHHPYR